MERVSARPPFCGIASSCGIGTSSFAYFHLVRPLIIVTQFGRRRPLIIGGIWQACWLFVFAAAGTAVDPEQNDSIGKRAFIPRLSSQKTGLIADAGSHDCRRVYVHPWIRYDLGSVRPFLPPFPSSCAQRIWDWLWDDRGIWILIGETFPTRTRAKQGALSTASNWTWNFLLAFFTPFIVSAIQFRYGFVFAGASRFLFYSSDNVPVVGHEETVLMWCWM